MNLIDGVRSIILATDANSYHYEGGGGGNFPPSVCDVMHLVIIYIFFKSKGYSLCKRPIGLQGNKKAQWLAGPWFSK